MTRTTHFEPSVDTLTTTELHEQNHELRLELLALIPQYRKVKRIFKQLDSLVGAKLSRQRDLEREIETRTKGVKRIPTKRPGRTPKPSMTVDDALAMVRANPELLKLLKEA